MSESDIVRVDVSLAAASSPTVANLNTGLIAAYHTHYPDRVRVYSTASVLTQLVTDGFSVNEPAYKAAQAYASAPNAPALLAIGRRANPPQQTLHLTCTDGTVGNAYDLTLVGSDGASHFVSYVNTIAAGTSLTGTVTTTNGSTAITFSSVQTLAKGTLLTFGGTGGQPGVYYALSAAITAATAAVLTAAYGGIGGAGETVTAVAPLAGTFDAVNGSPIVTSTTTQVGVVAPGDSVQFVSQIGTYYTVLSVTAPQLTLTQPYTGVTSATTNASDVAQVTAAASALQTEIAALSHVGTATVSGATITIARTDGQLTDVQGWVANGFGNIQLQDVTADPGITADLVAIQAANAGAWYALILDSNSAAEIEAAAAWIEATGNGGKVFFWNNSDYGNTQTLVTSDVFSQLQADAYVRNFGSQNNSKLLCYAGAATCGNALARNPGSYALAFMTLPGVPADSDTTVTEGQGLALNGMTASSPGPSAKNGNTYKSIAGINCLYPGTAPSGRFFDLTILIDWLTVTIQQAWFGVLTSQAAAGKTPYDDFGLGLLGDAVDGVLRLGASPAYGGILPDGEDPARPIRVTVAKVATIDATDRSNRNVPPGAISWSAGISGAVVTGTVAGTLTP